MSGISTFDGSPRGEKRGIARAAQLAVGQWCFGVAAACGTVFWFATLGWRALFDPDEGRYAEIPREMLRSGDWLTPHLNGIVYLEKPPLQYWLTAFSLRWFGETEWAARLCTGVAGYCSLVIVYFLGRRLDGNAAGVKALLLASASTLFVLMGHQLTLDMLLSFFLLLVLACFLMAQLERDHAARCRAWMLGSWCAMALAVLTKGLIGLVVPCTAIIMSGLWQRDRGLLRSLNVRWGLLLFAVMVTPWFVLVARANSGFFHFFFVREHVERFLTPVEHRSQPWWFFAVVLTVGILPWMPLALMTLAETWRAPVCRGRFEPARVLWAWSVFVVLFFSLSDSKLIPYILPAIPSLALLCASRPGCLAAVS